MGLSSSKQQLALGEAKKIRENLYLRVDNFQKNYQDFFDAIGPALKDKILNSTASELAHMLDAQEASTVEVLLVFIERTITVGIRNNYVLDEMFDEAVAEAQACDRQRKQDGNKKKCWRPGMDQSECYPPFYGVPTSMKQTMVMKGRQIHVGFVSKVNPLSDHDGLFTVMVRKMGFIPFVRSNVPQGCKTIETNNNIFGYCRNPWNTNRSCGGSSGGESGMVASRSAPIGFGSDIGGSLRIPAAFTGLAALKPHNRYSRLGNCYYGKFTGGLPIKSELGPIAQSVEDLILVHQFLCDPLNYQNVNRQFMDPYLKHIPLQLNIVDSNRKLRIGVIRRLKYAKCSKANERAVETCIEVLRQKGHQLVDVQFQKIEKLYLFLVNLFTFDQKLYLFSQFQGHEPLTVEYKMFILLSKIPWMIRKIIIWLIARKQPRLAKMLKQSAPTSGTKVFERIYEVEKVICPQIYKIFARNQLDAVLLPTFVSPAPKLGEISKLQFFLSFATVWNVLSYPVGTVPVTLVRPEETRFDDQFNDYFTKNVRKSMEGSEGLPVGVQIASTPYNEEKVLSVMAQLQRQLKFRQKHQIPL